MQNPPRIVFHQTPHMAIPTIFFASHKQWDRGDPNVLGIFPFLVFFFTPLPWLCGQMVLEIHFSHCTLFSLTWHHMDRISNFDVTLVF